MAAGTRRFRGRAVLSRRPGKPKPKESHDPRDRGFQTTGEARAMGGHRLRSFRNKGSEITRPYPPEWDAEPYPKGFKVPALHLFDGTQLASQHVYHFKSLTGSVSNNEAMMTRLFFGTLQGVAFEWFKHLKPGCIKSWNDLKRRFLHRFPDCDLDVSSVTLASIKQKEGEPIREYIERFRRTTGRTRGGLP